MHIGQTFAGIFPNAIAVFDFCDEISIKYDSRFISFAMSRIISGVFFGGVDSKTYSIFKIALISD